MNMQAPVTAAQSDRQFHDATKAADMSTLLNHAVKKSGRSALKIGQDFAVLAKGKSKINIVEYVRWKMYDADRYTPEQRAEFISNELHWPLIHAVCDRSWTAAAEDKVLCDTILRSGGVPVPQSVAVIDRSARVYPGLPSVHSANALRDLLLAHKGQELFGKITGGMVSFGAFRIQDADQTHITCAGHEPMTYDVFMDQFVGASTYLIQKKLENHPALAPFCSAIATVRMINLVRPGRIDNPVAVIKIPQGENIADAFWRPGNLACEVDVQTGEIKSVVALNAPDLDFLPDHPAVAGFMGFKLPHWDELVEINRRAAQIFAPIKYSSTDVAITPDGPVIVELNYGGGFDLPQNASGRGFLTPMVKEFFEENGVNFGASTSPAAAPKKSGFGLFGKRK